MGGVRRERKKKKQLEPFLSHPSKTEIVATPFLSRKKRCIFTFSHGIYTKTALMACELLDNNV